MNSEQRKEYHRRWYQENKERTMLQHKTYRDANKELTSQYNQTYYEGNKEGFVRRAKAYRESHREEESARTSAYHAANREQRRAYQLTRRYGLTTEEWTSLYQQQNGLSAICSKAFIDNDIVVDHCHARGKVRGLLCRRCNAGLGNFDDSADMLLRAHQYLSSR